jgi:hypothetical protein
MADPTMKRKVFVTEVGKQLGCITVGITIWVLRMQMITIPGEQFL